MSQSMITRCPKCSTTFRVTQEVLNMAKGKVRCGQCFHIFTAEPANPGSNQSTSNRNEPPVKPIDQAPIAEPQKTTVSTPPPPIATESVRQDGSVNPEWLDTLFHEEDLAPYTPPKNTTDRFVEHYEQDSERESLFPDDEPRRAPQRPIQQANQAQKNRETHRSEPSFTLDTYDLHDEPFLSDEAPVKNQDKRNHQTKNTSLSSQSFDQELAPWEQELAQLDAQFSAESPESDPIFSDDFAALAKPDRTGSSAAEQPPRSEPALRSEQAARTEQSPKPAPSYQTASETQSRPKPLNFSATDDEPDYMQALHSLASDISKQDTLSASEYSSQESMKQLAAEYSLASLTEPATYKTNKKAKSRFTWLWTIMSLFALGTLAAQVGVNSFDTGSRTAEFRSLYKVACTYLGCELPKFEDISAIEVEHLRIQSHPSIANALQVNAIMTNTSKYSQAMPKLALEFYDLNGRPVAARLFSPQDYLHKDFLDITYMPPNTPIHVVIPIQDPGARAVTHQIKIYSNETQSY